MPEQSNKKIQIGVIAAIVLGALGTGIGIYQSVKLGQLTNDLHKMNRTLSNMSATAATSVTFKNLAEFDTSVAASINKLVEQQQKDNISQKYAKFDAAAEQVGDGKHIYGDLNARFTLVEFSDIECPYCKRFHDTPKQLVDASKGNVNWQWKHMPLDFHNPAALKEAVAAECISEQKGNRGFWVFINDMFEQTQGNGAGVKDLAEVVTGVGADLRVFRECLATGKMDEKVQENIQQAKSLGINGTPATFVVDNKTGKSQLLGGAQPPEAIMAVMRKMMIESQPDDSTNQ
ncbi:protein-disulfide isomerase [Aeromonas hydrophila NJ-35]|uniref:DsbA family protein n=1 Tax=Aeromonas TaxID=642 RepID=UPI000640B672|nr:MULTISPECIES: DsbA family protein [Aeromonas]AKJ36889.1 protein-disulfide isomerase [Aeromonas hydrophila NJ-35]QGW99139.1 DsbA family protein [Aeromonas veronii]HDK8695663.1 DsbA family protein [Aeromonas hydrophila]